MTEYKQYSGECIKCGNKRLCEECDNRAAREKIIIDVIKKHIDIYGYYPSVDYIAKEIGIHKSNTHTILTRMADKGYIAYGNGKKGIIRVL